MLANDDRLFTMLAMFTAMVGNRVIKMALRTSIMVASIGVATIGKPRPSVPCTSPANRMTHTTANRTGVSNWSNEIIWLLTRTGRRLHCIPDATRLRIGLYKPVQIFYNPRSFFHVVAMALLVQKFGGTSVGTVERIEAVADKVIGYKNAGNDMVVVVSAMSGETNRLVELAKQIDPRARA